MREICIFKLGLKQKVFNVCEVKVRTVRKIELKCGYAIFKLESFPFHIIINNIEDNIKNDC